MKVGYVSPDLFSHPVALFLLPLLQAHDPAQVEAFCYSSVQRPDAVTAELRSVAHMWRDVSRWSDADFAEAIRRDGIDILVDLSMHSAGNRLLAFAAKPAPIQISWLAYPGSTGLETIDYCLTDSHITPPCETPFPSHERPIRLHDAWCCYQPFDQRAEAGDLPAWRNGFPTFGSLNKLSKIHDGVLRCWSRLLLAAEGSRLLMHAPEGQSRDRIRGIFAESGVRGDRLAFFNYAPQAEYVRLFRRMDLALDPFPCNGMTTTCDALWMGVPVVTLSGTTPVSRAGRSLLTTVGLTEFIAESEADYVRCAAECVGDLPRLAALRDTLRERMKASPLMDAPRFARNVEAAFRRVWREWCAGASAL